MNLRKKLERLAAINSAVEKLDHFIGFGVDKITIQHGNYDMLFTSDALKRFKDLCSQIRNELEGEAKRLMCIGVDLPAKE